MRYILKKFSNKLVSKREYVEIFYKKIRILAHLSNWKIAVAEQKSSSPQNLQSQMLCRGEISVTLLAEH